jgi:archaellum component FlaC
MRIKGFLKSDIELVQSRFESLNTHVQGFSEHLTELRNAGKVLSDTENPFQNMEAALANATRDIEILQGLNEQGLLGENGDAIVQKAMNSLDKLENKMKEVKAEIGKVPTTSFTKDMSKDLKDVSSSLDPVNTKIK